MTDPAPLRTIEIPGENGDKAEVQAQRGYVYLKAGNGDSFATIALSTKNAHLLAHVLAQAAVEIDEDARS